MAAWGDTERNAAIRAALNHRQTCGVRVFTSPLVEPMAAKRGWRFCVRCGRLMSLKRALTHQHFRCGGCDCIIVRSPRVQAPRAPRVPRVVTPQLQTALKLTALQKEQQRASAALAAWERRLTIALGKMKSWRAAERRIAKRIEDALAAREAALAAGAVVDGKTRRIQLIDDDGEAAS